MRIVLSVAICDITHRERETEKAGILFVHNPGRENSLDIPSLISSNPNGGS